MRQTQSWREWGLYKRFKRLPYWWDLGVNEPSDPLRKMCVRVMCDREVVEKTLAQCGRFSRVPRETVEILTEALEGSATLIALYGSYTALEYAVMCGLTPAERYGFDLYHRRKRW